VTAERKSSFASSAILTYGTNLTVAVLSLVNVLIVSRLLGAEGRGNVAFMTAIAWLVSNLSTFGVQEANANIAGSEPQARPALATNSVILAFVFGIASIVILTVLIALFPGIAGESTSALRWLTFSSLPILILGIYVRFLAQADYGFGVTNTAWLIGPIANVAVNGLLAVFGLLTVGTAVATWIGGQVLGTLLIVWYVWARLAGFGRPDKKLLKRTLGFGLKSHAGRVMLLGNYRLDQWLLGAISGPRQLGQYSVAVAWAEALWYLPTALSAVQRPDLVRANRRDAGRQAALAFRATALITALFAAVMAIAAPFLCVTIFGDEFHGSIDDLRLLLAGSIGIAALKLFGNALTAQREPTLASVAISAGFVCTIVLDLIFIPPLGGSGAALASSLAYIAAGVAISVIFLRKLGGSAGDLVPRGSEVPWMISKARSLVRRRTKPSEAEVVLAASAEEQT
jgi:O-antigen/teichoic acid export membrane protein